MGTHSGPAALPQSPENSAKDRAQFLVRKREDRDVPVGGGSIFSHCEGRRASTVNMMPIDIPESFSIDDKKLSDLYSEVVTKISNRS